MFSKKLMGRFYYTLKQNILHFYSSAYPFVVPPYSCFQSYKICIGYENIIYCQKQKHSIFKFTALFTEHKSKEYLIKEFLSTVQERTLLTISDIKWHRDQSEYLVKISIKKYFADYLHHRNDSVCIRIVIYEFTNIYMIYYIKML